MKTLVVIILRSFANCKDLWEDQGWPPVTDVPKINLTDFHTEFIFKDGSKRIKPLVDDLLLRKHSIREH